MNICVLLLKPVNLLFRMKIYLIYVSQPKPVTFDWTKAWFLRCWGKKLNWSSDGGDSRSKNCKRDHGDASGEVCVWREYGVRLSVLCYYVWQESDFRLCGDVYTFNLVYKDFFHKCCTYSYSTTCKDNAAVNYITSQHKRGPSHLLTFVFFTL